jgi:UDP-N-acetylglucosamine/UDP-N-acetylgalactosamine 4-epimerase
MYEQIYHSQDIGKYSFLITGGAGFIGSNLVEYLLKYGAKKVRVLDNLSTGFLSNLSEFESNANFEFIEGDIRDLSTCQKACENIDYVSHHAALGSVPRSINNPIATNEVNINGFLNMLVAVRDNKCRRFVYAASSSTYGDSIELPKIENRIGKPLSPYAVTKYVNELYADVFARLYGVEVIGLRYFNIFGPKQNPKGAYAAVIPLFMEAIYKGESPSINGDGTQSRDFTFVENAVQANVKALLTNNTEAVNQVCNIAVGDRTTLTELYQIIKDLAHSDAPVTYKSQRIGDIQHSLADISKAKALLDYEPKIKINEGLKVTFDWYKKHNFDA